MIARRASGSRSIWSIDSRPPERPIRAPQSPPGTASSVTRSLRRAIRARHDDRDRGHQPEEEPARRPAVRTGAARTEAGQGVAEPSRPAAVPEPGRPARAGTRRRDERDGQREPHRSGRGDPAQARPSSSVAIRAPDFLLRLGASRRVIQRASRMQRPAASATASTSADIRGGDDPLPSPSHPRRGGARHPDDRGEQKPTTTTAYGRSAPRGPRLASITRSLRCSLIADLRRYATEPPLPPAAVDQRSGNGPAGERRNDLRRHPDRRRPVANRVAVAAVGPPEPAQVPERRLAGFWPALMSAWIAHAVDCASDSRPFVSPKPPSRFWKGAQRDERAAHGCRRHPLPAVPRSRRRCRSSRGRHPSTTGSLRPSPAQPGSPARGSAARAHRLRAARSPSRSSR